MEQKKTVEEIKAMFPNHIHHIDADGMHVVGFARGTQYFAIQGSRTTEEEAWQEAYEWLTRTGRYDPEVDHHYHHKKSEES